MVNSKLYFVIGLPGSGKSFIVNAINTNHQRIGPLTCYGLDMDQFVIGKDNAVSTDINKLELELKTLMNRYNVVVAAGISDNIADALNHFKHITTNIFKLDVDYFKIEQRLRARAIDVNSRWWFKHFREHIDTPNWVDTFLNEKKIYLEESNFVSIKDVESLIVHIKNKT